MNLIPDLFGYIAQVERDFSSMGWHCTIMLANRSGTWTVHCVLENLDEAVGSAVVGCDTPTHNVVEEAVREATYDLNKEIEEEI